ncbi:MAG TPA: site-2 protease family protein [Terracidiphilus sp.]|nr:site-2 protease family protein [Terracidiphilus sp.]
MLQFRKFLCRWFGFLAALFAFVSFFTVRSAFTLLDAHRDLARLGSDAGPSRTGFILLLILARLVLLMPLPLAVCYGMAWWSVKKQSPALRGWAIAASIAMLVQAIPLVVLGALIIIHHWRGGLGSITFMLGAQLFLGVGGLAAFAGRDAARDQRLVKQKPPRIARDGTSGVLDVVAWIGAGGGYLGLTYLWWKWAAAHQLPVVRGLGFWALFFAASLVDSALHEAGHATVGLALRMQLRAFAVGPLRWAVREGRWTFQFQPRNLLSLGGATGVIPVDPNQSRWAEIAMIAAGPAASLAAGAAATAAAFMVKGTQLGGAWEFLALASTFGFISFAFNLIPLRPQALYSDGARIYQLLAGGVWADYHRVSNEASAALVGGLRARDYDIGAIQRAAAGIPHGPQALLPRLMAFSYFLDGGNLAEACAALRDTQRVCEESALEVPPGLGTWFVFAEAFLERDASRARAWWDRIEAKGVKHKDEMYWLAKCALAELEGNRAEAMEAWEAGNALAQKLPHSGAYELNRDCFARVQTAMMMDTPVAAVDRAEEAPSSLR